MKGKVTKTGYKKNSPDVNNDYNIIPSGRITMRDVQFPVYGVDEYGNTQMMYPGGEYQFPGNQVFELPMAQLGGMRRGKVDRILNENRDLNFVQRMYQPSTPSIMIPGQDGPSTHFMESADGFVYPTVVQMPDGNLQYLGEGAYDHAMQTGEYIQFPNDRQARRFAKSYKKGTGVLEEYGKGGLTQWFDEKWVDVKTGEECGRSGKDKDGRPYPACRPSKRVNETTPKTTSEMSSSEKAKFKREKTSGKRINYNHKRAQDGTQVEPTSWTDYINPMNWGVSTYDDAGTFNQAFAKARQEGQDEFMWYGNRYNTELAPQSDVTSVPVKKQTPPDEIDLDFDTLKRGVSFVESRNGKYMWNPESSATGLYGQRFSEIKDSDIYSGTRENFRDDVDAQNRVFQLRYEGELPGSSTGLKQDALDLYREYYPIVKKNNISPVEIAALSNFLGRQGTRYYLGYVLRDGRSLEGVFPKLYGSSAEQSNKTPDQYLQLFREAAYAQQEAGGEIEKYPDYSDHTSYVNAWKAARRQLGVDKKFKYGGRVMSTCTPNGQ